MGRTATGLEEGLALPIMPLARRRVMNEDLLRSCAPMSASRSRSKATSTARRLQRRGSRRLVDMMSEFEISHLETLGNQIIEASRAGDLGRDPQAAARQDAQTACAWTATTSRCCSMPR